MSRKRERRYRLPWIGSKGSKGIISPNVPLIILVLNLYSRSSCDILFNFLSYEIKIRL